MPPLLPSFGSFVPTTNVWDVSEIYSTDVNSPEFKELLIRLYQNLNIMSVNLNLRDIGYYDTNEQICGQLYFPNPNLNSGTQVTPGWRPVFRKVIDVGALPNTATKSVAHGIIVDTTFIVTRIYGAATDPVALTGIPLPYSTPAALNQAIALSYTATNIVITTGINYASYTTSYVVIEYLKF